jgi:hypothetical protein
MAIIFLVVGIEFFINRLVFVFAFVLIVELALLVIALLFYDCWCKILDYFESELVIFWN